MRPLGPVPLKAKPPSPRHFRGHQGHRLRLGLGVKGDADDAKHVNDGRKCQAAQPKNESPGAHVNLPLGRRALPPARSQDEARAECRRLRMAAALRRIAPSRRHGIDQRLDMKVRPRDQ
jgi:hypothetical protein